MGVFFVGKQMLGVVYLLVTSQGNERKEQTLNKGCAFSSCSGGKQTAMGSARLRVVAVGSQSCRMAWGAHVQPGGGRSPVVNGQVLLLLVGITVASLAVVRKMRRSGWGGKLNSIVALPVGLLPLSGVQEICLARIHSSISLLLEKKQSKWSLGFLIQSFS